MNAESRQLIQSSWRQVIPIADAAAFMFYQRLFEIDPEVKPYFDGVDMTKQRGHLIQALGSIVNSLDDIDSVLPRIQALGRRHAGYGVKDRHYGSVGAALIWTLQQGVGDAWNAETEAAWIEAYELVSTVMQDAAAEDGPTGCTVSPQTAAA